MPPPDHSQPPAGVEELAKGQRWLGAFYSQLEYNLEATSGRTGGTRLKLEYPRGLVDRVAWPNKEDRPNFIGKRSDGQNFSGSVRSGGDWAFISEDYVLSFDSRVTLQLGLEEADFKQLLLARDEDQKTRNREIASGPNGLLVEMTLRGMANLDPSRFDGGPADVWIPVTMSARFEGPTSKQTSNASREEEKRSELFKKYFRTLTQYQFHAPGRLLVQKATREAAEKRALRPAAILLSFFYDATLPSGSPLPAVESPISGPVRSKGNTSK